MRSVVVAAHGSSSIAVYVDTSILLHYIHDMHGLI
jgi:hypothetical protein